MTAAGLPSSSALLPAFDPSSFSSGSPPPPHLDRRTGSNASISLSTPPSSPSPSISSSKGNFFTRARANSVHSSSSRRPSTADVIPPVPSSLAHGLSTPPSSASKPSFRLADERDHHDPAIKFVSVPHHAKSGNGKWVFACRVVPEPYRGASRGKESVAMARTGSLGRMEMAGAGQEGASEPHTVWRSWSEFVELSSKLSARFPVVPPSSNLSSSSSSSTTSPPSSFYRQTPRLSRKLTLFVTRSTLLQRQDDLDLFVRRLFEMPDIVKKDLLVRDFFRPREGDLHTSPFSSTTSDNSEPPSPEPEPDSFARFLSEVSSPNATIRAATAKTAARRPQLQAKRSVPDLRKQNGSFEADSPFDLPVSPRTGKPLNRPLAPGRLYLDATVRSSKYSISASSTSSSTTITPMNMSLPPSRMPSPSPLSSSRPSLHSLQFDNADGDESIDVTPLASPKRPRQLLRHFMSLQDLRRPSTTELLTPPVPSPTSAAMARAQTQPTPRSPPPVSTLAAPRSAGTATSSPANSHRTRSGSKSSISSLDDVSAGHMSPHLYGTPNAGFRLGPTGRLGRVPESGSFGGSQRGSLPRNSAGTVATRTSGGHGSGHSPAPSTSSLASSRSSAAGSSDMSRSFSTPDYRSRRSSTDFSDMSLAPSTPPTPQLEEFSSKYFVNEHGTLAQNNTVPLPPFFPVPPSMSSAAMMAAYSQDGLPHSPRPSHGSRPSLDSRSRTGSVSSNRTGTDHGLRSPQSASSVVSSPTSRPQDRPTVTFKVLHSESNLVFRLSRTGLTLDLLRSQIERKFALSCGVKLYGETGDTQWALSYTVARSSGDGRTHTDIVLSESDFQLALERTAHLEKVSLRIIS